MANCYSDRPELRFELNHPLMQRIVELKERNFREKGQYDYAPEDFEDAMDSYHRVLDIVGDITASVKTLRAWTRKVRITRDTVYAMRAEQHAILMPWSRLA